MLSYAFIILAVVVFMNTYFLITTRDMIFDSKQKIIQSQASLLATSLGADSTLTWDRIGIIIEQLDTAIGDSNIAVMDSRGMSIYDTLANKTEEQSRFISQYTQRSLLGNDIYYSSFHGSAFSTSALVPIMNRGAVIGSVYVNETDLAQGSIMTDLQNTVKNVSILLAVVSAFIIIVVIWTVMRRINGILKGVVSVREGEYNYLIKIRGNDELAQLGSEFNELTERLRSTDEVRRRFVADASHELKTPLAAIRLLSDSIIQNRDMDIETVHEFVDDIGNEAERLARTTEKLMSLTRLDSGIAASAENIDVRPVILGVLRMLRPIAANQGLSVSTALGSGCFVRATEDDMYQIAFNLIENAIKYNLPGGSINVTLEHSDKRVTFTVDDTGIGIPDKDMPYIFDRFYRVDKARSRDAGGSGLGLSIVRDTVVLHGGTITATARKNGGTRFRVVFPLCGQPEYLEKGSELNEL